MKLRATPATEIPTNHPNGLTIRIHTLSAMRR